MKNIIFIAFWLGIVSGCQRNTMVHYNSIKTSEMGLPFSEAVVVGDMIYLSGQLGIIPGQMKLVDGGIGPETRQTMKNIEATLLANGATLDNIIKCTVMLDDIAEWEECNREYVTFFPGQKPARSAFGTSGLALGARVEIECLACKTER